jgi:superoxide dismutase
MSTKQSSRTLVVAAVPFSQHDHCKNSKVCCINTDDSLRSYIILCITMQAGTRNAIGGHYNHALFWTTLAPAAKSGSPSQALQKAIDDSFGSTDAMKEKFNAAAAGNYL